MRSCPRCREALTTRTVSDASIELCPGCAGILIDRSRARRLFFALGLRSRPLEACDGQHDLGCPSCRRSMQWRVVPEGSVQYLECPAHGAWFDCFELARLVSPDSDLDDLSVAQFTDTAGGSAARAAAAIATLVANRTVGLDPPPQARCDHTDAGDRGEHAEGRAWSVAAVDWALAFVGNLGLEFSS